MTEQTHRPFTQEEQERIKLLQDECKIQVSDFYEQGISPLLDSGPFKYNAYKSTEPIIKKMFKALRHLFLLQK